MKNKLYLFLSVMGTTFLLTGCNVDTASLLSGSGETQVQGTVTNPITTTNTQTGIPAQGTGTPAANTTGMTSYVQIFVDPQTGQLVTLDPATGQLVPYAAPVVASQDATAQTNNANQAAAQANATTQATPQNNTTTQAATTQNNTTNQAAAPQNNVASQPAPVQNNTVTQAPAAQNNTTTQAAAPQANTTTTTSNGYIGESRALQIALDHAGVKASDTLFSYAKLDYDDGRYEYDVEFYAGNQEYDYEIDARTGRILAYDYDMESHFVPPAQQGQAGTGSVSIETAKQTALSRVPGATANNIRIYSDYDDGRLVYEGKIIYNAMEYEFEISAATGAIIEWDVESVYD